MEDHLLYSFIHLSCVNQVCQIFTAFVEDFSDSHSCRHACDITAILDDTGFGLDKDLNIVPLHACSITQNHGPFLLPDEQRTRGMYT